MSHKENLVPGNGRGHLDQSRVVRLRCVDKTRIRCTLTHASIDSQDANACKPNTERQRECFNLPTRIFSSLRDESFVVFSLANSLSIGEHKQILFVVMHHQRGSPSSNNIKASNVWTTLRHWQNQGENDDQEEEEVDGKFAPTRIVFR